MPSRKEAPTPKKTRRPAVAQRAAQPAEGTVAASSAPAPAPSKAVKKATPAAAEVFGRASGKTPSKAAVAKAAIPVNATEPSKAVKPVKAVKPPKPAKPAKPAMDPAAETPAAGPKPPKHKLVRDSFTIPRGEYQQLDALKQRLVTLLRPTKKSELLRAGIKLLSSLPDDALLAAVNDVPAIKTGRPVKS